MGWILILCLAGDMNRSCEYRGGVAVQSVSEAQCRVALTLDANVRGWCLSPQGELIVTNAAKR